MLCNWRRTSEDQKYRGFSPYANFITANFYYYCFSKKIHKFALWEFMPYALGFLILLVWFLPYFCQCVFWLLQIFSRSKSCIRQEPSVILIKKSFMGNHSFIYTGSSRLMRISLLRILLLRFFKTITKIWLMRFYRLFILLLRT